MDCVRELIHFFYPSYCLHCGGRLEKGSQPLCRSCFSSIEWIDPKERCRRCFAPLPCKEGCFPLYQHRSCFEAYGPIMPLIAECKRSKRLFLLASLIIVQLARSPLPAPDCIVPITVGPFHKQELPFLLAKEMARLYQCQALLPSKKVRDKSVLLLIDRLQVKEPLIEARSRLRAFFPRKIYTLAVIDER